MTELEAVARINEVFAEENNKDLKHFDPGFIALILQLLPLLFKLCPEKSPEKLKNFCKNRRHVAARQVKSMLRERNKKYDKLLKVDDELSRAIVRSCADCEVKDLESVRGVVMSKPVLREDDSDE